MEKSVAAPLKVLFAPSDDRWAFLGCGHIMTDRNCDALVESDQLNATKSNNVLSDETKSESERHTFENLVLLCSDCKQLAESKSQDYTPEHLQEIRCNYENYYGRSIQWGDLLIANALRDHPSTTDDIEILVIDTPEKAQATDANSETSKTAQRERLLGDDPNASRYIAYLIRRYNEFAAKEVSGSQKFNSKAISQNIESRYSSHWKLVGRDRFPHICHYLQRRIERTRIGASNSSKRRASYRSYQRFLMKPHRD